MFENICLYAMEWMLLYAVCMVVYFSCSQGLVWKTKRQQIIRYFHMTLVTSVILWLVNIDFVASYMIPVYVVFVLWVTTFPFLEYITHKKSSIEINNVYDIAFAISIFGILGGMSVLTSLVHGFFGIVLQLVLSVVEFILILPPILQIGYYLLYKVSIDANGMQILQETHYNEIIEYVKGYSVWKSFMIFVLLIGVLVGFMYVNIVTNPVSLPWWAIVISIVAIAFLSFMSFKRRGIFSRTGIINLYGLVEEYCKNNEKYTEFAEKRLQNVSVKPMGASFDRPSTILMVIGESASRDYMSAFSDCGHDTTPWLRECRKDEQHFVFYDNSYSCGVQTVPTLERALTEKNQYNDKEFYDSCSIVDIAHKMGYTVHWYSNQGHLGAAETPITLVANTSDVAKWTLQKLNAVQYDESLLNFMDEVDPSKNNFVVLHLKGNHVNYINRYPQDKTVWGEPGVVDLILNYKNSIHYTDSVLQAFFDYAKEKLNLQAMVFFSDHACVPDVPRTPNFNDFGMVRIPMFVYLSDEYKEKHLNRFNALKHNEKCYFSNDLAYELMCGIFDVESNHFDETNSLASNLYKYTYENVLTNEGRTHVSEELKK